MVVLLVVWFLPLTCASCGSINSYSSEKTVILCIIMKPMGNEMMKSHRPDHTMLCMKDATDIDTSRHLLFNVFPGGIDSDKVLNTNY